MQWKEVAIYTTTAGIEAVTAVLLDRQISGFVVEDAADFQQFLQDTQPRWDYVDEDLVRQKSGQETRLIVYLPDNEQGRQTLAGLREDLAALRARDTAGELGRLELAADTTLEEKDWENNWKEFFKPFPVGERFVIKPSWETVADAGGRQILEIDPASSFGTGTHHTTQLCIRELERVVTPGCRLLDMGCGSGILFIAAHLLGAGELTAVDIDENAARIAAENAEKNGAVCRILAGDVLADPALAQQVGDGYDVIVANIVADVIRAMAGLFWQKLRPGGTLIVSGIIGERAEEVRRALEGQGFCLLRRQMQQDWAALTLTRPE